jgi:hypothetical protein
MYDYEMAIEERFEELCEDFEEKQGRPPTNDEKYKLYSQAKDATDDALASMGDAMRKEAKGE